MKKVIYKYPLSAAESQTIMMPYGAQILSAQVQDHAVCVWALVDPDERLEVYTFTILVTGPDSAQDAAFFVHNQYVGTFQDNWFVGHVFARKS